MCAFNLLFFYSLAFVCLYSMAMTVCGTLIFILGLHNELTRTTICQKSATLAPVVWLEINLNSVKSVSQLKDATTVVISSYYCE